MGNTLRLLAPYELRVTRVGVIADLHTHESQAQGGWNRDYTAPDANETFEEFAQFFDRDLGK